MSSQRCRPSFDWAVSLVVLGVVVVLSLPHGAEAVCRKPNGEKVIKKKIQDTVLTTRFDPRDRSQRPMVEVNSEQVGSQTPPMQGLVKFSSIKLPKGAELFDATLELYTHQGIFSLDWQVELFRMRVGWDESTAEWGLNPFDHGVVLGRVALDEASFTYRPERAETAVKLTVTDDVQYWLSPEGRGNRQGWAVLLQPTTSRQDLPSEYYSFYSSNEANKKRRPRLKLRYCTAGKVTVAAPVPPPSTGFYCTGLTRIATTGAHDTVISRTNAVGAGGTATRLEVTPGQGASQVLLKFPTLPQRVPSHITVLDAQLRLYVSDAAGPTSPSNPRPPLVYGHRMIMPWTPDSATWFSFGGDGVMTDNVRALQQVSWSLNTNTKNRGIQLLNVKRDVVAWLQDGAVNEGWVLTLQRGVSFGRLELLSSELPDVNLRPQLEIMLACDDTVPHPAPSPSVVETLWPTRSDDGSSITLPPNLVPATTRAPVGGSGGGVRTPAPSRRNRRHTESPNGLIVPPLGPSPDDDNNNSLVPGSGSDEDDEEGEEELPDEVSDGAIEAPKLPGLDDEEDDDDEDEDDKEELPDGVPDGIEAPDLEGSRSDDKDVVPTPAVNPGDLPVGSPPGI